MNKHSESLETHSLSAIEHLLQHRPEMIRSLRLSDKDSLRLRAIEDLARGQGIRPSREHGMGEGEGAIATLVPYPFIELKKLIERLADTSRALVVVLDHIQDPQNLGALCRTAEALGAKGLVIPKHRSAPVTGTVFSASAGAVATLPLVLVANIGESLRQLKEAGFWIVGSTLSEGATNVSEMPDFEKMALVLGAEGQGMAPLTEKLCDWKLQIPLRGMVQSLNVSAAGAILMHELLKRHSPA
jgi:23S rRNA (guanosine2251-2'-O)-methyltransferase